MAFIVDLEVPGREGQTVRWRGRSCNAHRAITCTVIHCMYGAQPHCRPPATHFGSPSGGRWPASNAVATIEHSVQ